MYTLTNTNVSKSTINTSSTFKNCNLMNCIIETPCKFESCQLFSCEYKCDCEFTDCNITSLTIETERIKIPYNTNNTKVTKNNHQQYVTVPGLIKAASNLYKTAKAVSEKAANVWSKLPPHVKIMITVWLIMHITKVL